ncbi:MAG TPA: choice-of-anchor D domain-containing protein [Candidatus Binataceae bacterium]|nr:choice-of-anchor D domain-containing protein [Candidatus Binataceae bacterium]
MSRSIKGASSRGFLRLALVGSYLAVLAMSLFGVTPTIAQISSPTPTITPTPTSMLTPVASTLTVAPAKLSFGFQLVLPPDGAPSKPKNLTLSVAKNQPQPVTVELPLMVSDQNAPPQEFLVQPNTCGVIAPGQSCQVPIVFQPSGTHARPAILMITSNASNGVLSVDLIGHGKQGVLTIKPSGLSFPVLAMGGTPGTPKTATITNNNSIPLSIHGITSSNPSVFPITDDCPATLAPGASCTISVSFVSDRNGTIRGRVNISDNAAGPDRVSLTGSGRGFPVVTRTPRPTQTPRPTATMSPGLMPMRAFPPMH